MTDPHVIKDDILEMVYGKDDLPEKLVGKIWNVLPLQRQMLTCE